MMTIAYAFLLLFGFHWIPFGESSVSKSDGIKLRRAIITKGKEAKIWNFPYAVSLQKYHKVLRRYEPLCTASLITTMAVLSAAHCMTSKEEGYLVGNINDYIGVLGTVDRMDRTNNVTFQEICIHPKYTHEYLFNDIALLVPSKPVKLGRTIQTIPLIGAGMSVVGMNGKAAGWGKTDKNDREPSRMLRYADVDIAIFQMCEAYLDAKLFKNKQLCYGSKEKGICKGDSGGPVVVNFDGDDVLVGIASFRNADCKRVPSVGTNVSSYNTWIRNKAVGTPVFISW